MAEPLTKAGRYQIVGELGRGSMGVVYKGFDPVIGRIVAIKTMLPSGLSPQEFEEYKTRFQREAMAAGILAHPNIITVYDFGEDDGVLYLAMEFLEGKSLEKIVQELSVVPIEMILPIFDQTCSALDHAHRNGIVHRDVKPANIMILQNGLVKMTDFGIAKMMDMGMTQAGQILGTPNYMSPEQVKGREIDGRSDIFSLGVILYELITGEKPFGGQNITTVIYKIINENPISPLELDASIHPGLSYVISKALAKNPDQRYQSCGDLARDLRNYQYLSEVPLVKPSVATVAPPIEAMAMGEVSQLIVPPSPMPPGRGTAFDETPIASRRESPPAPVYVEQKKSPLIWILGSLVLVALAAGIEFLVVRQHHRATPATMPQEVVTTPAVPSPDSSAAPTTTTLTPTPPPLAVTPIAPTAPSAPETTKSEHEVTPSGAKTGDLTVGANVPGARITVDGKSDASWVTPHTIENLPAGMHTVQVSMDGYDSFQQSVMVAAGETENFQANLSAPNAEFTVNTKPAGLEVTIDGKSYGPSPVRATLAAGQHTYSVMQPDGTPYQNTVTLRSGSIVSKTLTLSTVAASGTVEVRTTPPGATVTADGAAVNGQTPTSCRLAVGNHTLVISLSGFRPVQQQVSVSENQTSSVNVSLVGQ